MIILCFENSTKYMYLGDKQLLKWLYSILFFNNSFQLALLGWLSNMHNGVTKYLDVLPIEKKDSIQHCEKICVV